MDNAILEVVIGLILIYAIVALLVMKLQELHAGSLLRYRAGVVHDHLREAVGRDEALKQKILENPLIFALFKDDAARKSRLRDSGPSNVPHELFTRALLTELNGGGTHPAHQFAAPSAFMAAQAPAQYQQGAATNATRIWRSLAALMPGREASWQDFEAAIGRWYCDIGDRAEGWFKQRATLWTFGLAALLCAGLNIDTFHIASTLSTDPQLRLGIADLAARVVQARENEGNATGGPAAAPASLAARAQTQAVAGLTDAITRLNNAFRNDKDVAQVRGHLVRVAEECAIVRCAPGTMGGAPSCTPDGANEASGQSGSKPADQASAKGGKQGVRDDQGDPSPTTYQPSGRIAANAMLSNSDIWLKVLPIVQTRVKTAQLDSGERAAETYRQAFRCVASVSSWVSGSVRVSGDSQVNAQMQEAAVALASAETGLLALADQQRPSLSLQRAFREKPEAFDSCAQQSRTRAAFDDCLQRELKGGVNLPLFWVGNTRRAQFCTASAAPHQATGAPTARTAQASASAAAATALTVSVQLQEEPPKSDGGGLFAGLCTARFAGSEALGLPALALAAQDWALPVWLLGVVATTIFVSLGAPFWFGLLGKVVSMRSAGMVRDDAESLRRGAGNAPLADAPSAGAPRPAGSAAPPAGAGPFATTRNAFEDQLLAADIVRLQQRRGLEATGVLDVPTRESVKEYCRDHGVEPATDELSAPLYLQIVGRPAGHSPRVAAQGRLVLGQVAEQVPLLAATLNEALDFSGRVPATQRLFNDELRALTVLYRYKRDTTVPVKDRQVFRTATSHPAQLDEVDEALLDEMLKLQPHAFPRDATAAWMDWAVGELGQVEHDSPLREASNQRICEYLDMAQKAGGSAGDRRPWCGAFVAWVIKRHLGVSKDASPILPGWPGNPLLAANWATFGTERGAQPWQFGDLVLFKATGPDTSGHVAFFVAADAQHVWALGGNQHKGSRVSLTAFPLGEVRTVRHWAAAAAAAAVTSPTPPSAHGTSAPPAP